MVKQKKVQTGKKDIYAGFGIGKDELDRCVACDYVIDCNIRSPNNPEPRMKK